MNGTIIVVPCYNEAERLQADVFIEFAQHCPDLHFLFVNDGSHDGTLEVLRQVQGRDPEHCSFLDLSPNRGKAEAVRHGMLAGFARDARFVGFWDADLATPLEAIPKLRAVLEQRDDIDLVMGSRVQMLGRSIERHLARHYLGRVVATAASLVLGLGVYDTQCGAKLFRNTPEIAGLFEGEFMAKWTFDIELIARLIHARRASGGPGVEHSIYEQPLDAWYDVAGSKVKPSDFPKAFLELWKIRRRWLS